MGAYGSWDTSWHPSVETAIGTELGRVADRDAERGHFHLLALRTATNRRATPVHARSAVLPVEAADQRLASPVAVATGSGSQRTRQGIPAHGQNCAFGLRIRSRRTGEELGVYVGGAEWDARWL